MLNESPVHIIDLIRKAISIGKTNTTTFMMAIGLAHLIDSLEHNANPKLIDVTSRENMAVTMRKIKNIISNIHSFDRDQAQMGSSTEGLTHYIDYIERKMLNMYDEFGVNIHNDK